METIRCVLLKQGEIFLKGENRSVFQKKLRQNFERTFPSECGQIRVQPRGGVVVLYPQRNADHLAARMTEVPGINVVDIAVHVPKETGAIVAAALGELRRRFGEDLSAEQRAFAVISHRRDKQYPLTSEQLNRGIGAEIQKATGWPVNLSRPEVSIRVEINFGEAFVSVERLRGLGGLPVGSSGRAMVLLSGGFDSPVAGFRMMKRGLACDFIHFSGAPYTDPSSTYKAYALVKQLSRFQPASRLWVAQLGTAQRTLASSSDPALRTVAQRRLMLRIAEELAHRQRAAALVTGDSLGQVASQTLSNIATVDQATTLPVLRPLVGWDKEEIIAEARRIGTEEISVLPDQDCCTLLAPPRPATHSDAETLLKVEKRAGIDDLVAGTVANLQEFRFAGGHDTSQRTEEPVAAG
ncbi:tRNA uracil 4-sulfurtransferase ThiI [Nesterenkonia alba]|uniref:tRNA uracil 4-sulfurtransferase ThiI n=1 Tax=Nesterenkonia alba TaxID=515814 RepID=UPI0003B677A3|nr:tRNA uracil 4-sulfurtransferase ThiI [Nesterenkonia alba]